MESWLWVQLGLTLLAAAMLILATIMGMRASRLVDLGAKQIAHLRAATLAVGALTLVILALLIAAVFA